MRAIVAAFTVTPLLLLAGCGQADKTGSPAAVTETGPANAKLPPAGQGGGETAVTAPLLAYDYSVSLQVPAARARGLMARHQQACEAAGAALCQVVKARSTASGRDQAFGRLEVRAEPAWLKRFRDSLVGDAEAAGGHLTAQETEAEDLTRSIVDTEATLRAATALQTRLERMLVERPGSLQDALAIEQELARVRGTIDATRSTLAVMKGRVATSKLSIQYQSRGVKAAGEHSPIRDAFADFLGNLGLTAALLIRLLSFLLLPALIGVPVAWWLIRRSRRPKAPRPPAPSSFGGPGS